MRATLFAVLFSCSIFLAGCAGGMSNSSNSNQTNQAMPAVTLSSSSTSVTTGSTVALTWTTANATSITISPAVAPAGAMLPLNGSATVTPWSTTTYTATAIGSGGSAQSQVKISVNAAQPQIALSVTPGTIENGASATLTWSTKNATMVTIGGFAQQPPQGSLTVSPDIDQTYTATAWNGPASQSASATLHVQNTQTIVAVNMAGPDNYYFTPSPLADSLSLYGLNSSTGTLSYLGGSQDADLFSNSGNPAFLASADGRWLFVQETDGPVVEFSLTELSNFEASRRQVTDSSVQLVGSDPVSNVLIFFVPGMNGSSPFLEFGKIGGDGTVYIPYYGTAQVLPSAANMPAVFDNTGNYFVLGTQLYRLTLNGGDSWITAVGSSGPNSNTIIGFDQSNSHLLAHTTTATASGYQDQISVYDYNTGGRGITLNNSKTVIPARGGDFNVFGFSNNVLWVLSQGVMGSYRFDPVKATLTPTGNQFNVAEGFQIPFAIDSMTNTIVQPAAQANQMNSYVVDQGNGNSRGSNGPYQAGTAPWTLAVAHVQ